MEDFLRDSLGIVEENVMQMVNEKEVCNVSFTSVLASIEEELNNEETVEDEADMIMSRTEPPPSLQKLEAQRATILKLGLDSVTVEKLEKEEEEQKEVEQEEMGPGESFEELNNCDEEMPCIRDKESPAEETQHWENGLLLPTQELGLTGVKEKPEGVLGGIEEAEKREKVDNSVEGKVEVEVQAETHEHLGCRIEAKELDGQKEGVGESNFQEEGGGCLQNEAMHKNASDGHGEGGIDSKGVEGQAGEGEEGNIKESVGAKELEHSKNTSRDSGLSRSGEVSFVENEQEEKVESSEEKNEAVKDNPGVHRNVSVLKDREVLGRDSEITAKEQSENNDVKNLTLKVKALASTTTATPDLSVEAVTEDFAWFDCPGLKVAEVEDGLQVDVEDRQLGIAAMEGLKHKYSITQQV